MSNVTSLKQSMAYSPEAVQKIAEVLSAFIAAKNPNKSELARFLGVTPPMIDNWARAKHSRIDRQDAVEKILDPQFEDKFERWKMSEAHSKSDPAARLGAVQSFDNSIGLADPRIKKDKLYDLLKEYGPITPDDGVPYAAIVFPSGKIMIAVGEGQEAIEEMIKQVIERESFVGVMTPALSMMTSIKESSQLIIMHADLTFFINVYGKWVPKSSVYSFTEAVVSICNTPTCRPDLVKRQSERFEKRLRKFVEASLAGSEA